MFFFYYYYKGKKSPNEYCCRVKENASTNGIDDSEDNKDIKDFFISVVTAVGTVSPVSDFRTLLEKGRPFERGLCFYIFYI